jgi:hypothetical protein
MSRARESTHAPLYAFWVGARLGVLGYGGGLYAIDANSVETVGNFVQPGAALEGDAGARISARYIPYVALELGFVGAGHRFAHTSTSVGTTFEGVGFRYLAGDLNTASFATDVSLGFRQFQASNGGGTWSANGLELFRLGLGAEVRVSTLFTFSPMLTVSAGSLSDTRGHVSFAPNQGDKLTGPLFQNGQQIAGAQTTYYTLVLGCGAHFDLFGK